METDSSTKIVWLASYPKSGSTWVRVILTNLLCGKPNFFADVEQIVPDLHLCLTGEHILSVEDILNWDTVLVKSHFKLDEKMHFFDRTVSFIYIIRNPLDVMMSNLNYFFLCAYEKMLSTYSAEEMNDFPNRYIEEYLKQKGDRRWIDFGMGNWEEHVKSWLKNPYGFPQIAIRYEDLIADAFPQVRRICEFLDLDISDRALREAIANSSFSEMKKLEEESIANKEDSLLYRPRFKAAHQSGFRFMNKGKAGEGKRKLSPEQFEQAKESFFPLMEEFGYL